MKKGDFNLNQLVSIILIVAVLVVISLFLIVWLNSFYGKTDRELCRNGVLSQSLVINFDSDLITPSCKTNQVRFYNDHVEINGKRAKVNTGESKVSKYQSLNSDIVNSVVAEELRGCWYQFLEGKQTIWSTGIFWHDVGANCFICSEINFDPLVESSPYEGFFEYTKSTMMPNTQISYYDYYARQDRISSKFYDRSPDKNEWEEYADGLTVTQSFWQSIKSTFSVVLGDYCSTIVGTYHPPIKRDISFDRSKTYAVIFLREGEATSFSQSKLNENCNLETYFAYVLPAEEIPMQCSYTKRGTS